MVWISQFLTLRNSRLATSKVFRRISNNSQNLDLMTPAFFVVDKYLRYLKTFTTILAQVIKFTMMALFCF